MNTVSTSSTVEVFDINSDNFDLLEFLLNYEISTLHIEQKVSLTSKISRASLDLSEKDGKVIRKFGIVNIYVYLVVSKTKLCTSITV